MFQTDHCLVTCIMDQKISAALRDAESARLLREAGIDPRAGLIRQVHRWLYRLGHNLVSLGQRLERFDASIECHHSASQSKSA
jgi:hypothetical protein